jgi:radical SAM superfamily enzyme YgiQ (UPF0313 family)
MRVLIVSGNREVTPDPVYPIGAAYVAAAVREAGHDVDLLDVLFFDDFETAIAERIHSFEPDLVGVSFRNIDNVAYPLSLSYMDENARVVAAIRAAFTGPVVLGGSAFTMMPAHMLAALGETMGIVGEGEAAVVRLIDALSGKGAVADIPGLIMRDGQGVTVNNPPSLINDIDRIPRPASDLCDNAAYLKWGGMGSVQTKRGCPFGCIYCTYPVVEGRAVRVRDPKTVVDEMESSLDRWGVDTFFIVDSVFNGPPEHAHEIARHIIRRGLSVRLSAYMSPAFITEGLLADLLQAGLTGLDLGADSLADPILKRLGKNFTSGDVVKAIRAAQSVGMMVCLNTIFAAPGETPETMRRTADLIDELSPTAHHAMVGIRIFPGTGLQRLAIGEGMEQARDIGLDPVFYISPPVAGEVVGFVHERAMSRPSWLVPGQMVMAGQDFTGTMRPDRYDRGVGAPFRTQGIRGPLWEMLGQAGK